MSNNKSPDWLPLEMCTGCGRIAFACVVIYGGEGSEEDQWYGPYALCEDAHELWLTEGDNILYIHD